MTDRVAVSRPVVVAENEEEESVSYFFPVGPSKSATDFGKMDGSNFMSLSVVPFR